MLRSFLHLALAAAALLTTAQAAHAAFLFDVGAEETVAMAHLPTWVQVVTESGRLFSGDTSATAVASGKLARYTFLRVLNGGEDRLQVEAVDERGESAARGWIDPDDVLPSASAQGWLVASDPTTLWQNGVAIRQLDRFTPMQQFDGPVQGRIEVRVYRSDLLAVVDSGWVDQAATGPAFAPATRVPDASGFAARRPAVANQQEMFLADAAQAATTASARTGVPASVTVAQAILESDWGRSALAQSASNYFGIKATGGLGNDGLVWMPTGEFDADGQAYQTTSPFRAYRSLADSLIDHDLMLRNGRRYADAMQARHDPREFAQALADAGYATDPDYAGKLIALMDRYDLYRLDA